MPDSTPIFDLPRPIGPDAADGPGAFDALTDRLEAVFAAGLRSSGSSVIAAEQSTNATAYTELGTPDRVQGLVVDDGPASLIVVAFRALVKFVTTGGGAGASVALFVGENQLKVPANGSAPIATEVGLSGPGKYQWLLSGARGLVADVGGATDASDGVTTGLALGLSSVGGTGLCVIGGLPSGTYEVSVRYKVTGASTAFAKERRLTALSFNAGLPPA